MPHSPSSRTSRRGFTLIEIAVILVIIALVLAIIIPHFFLKIQEARARRVLNDLVTLNSAIEHYALDSGKVRGQPSFSDIQKYIDRDSDVYRRDGSDVFGDSYGPFTIGSRPSVPNNTRKKLESVAGPDFWSPYQ
jgi:prepilin-type N-terminal cleavage/methylation domain-containing protein